MKKQAGCCPAPPRFHSSHATDGVRRGPFLGVLPVHQPHDIRPGRRSLRYPIRSGPRCPARLPEPHPEPDRVGADPPHQGLLRGLQHNEQHPRRPWEHEPDSNPREYRRQTLHERVPHAPDLPRRTLQGYPGMRRGPMRGGVSCISSQFVSSLVLVAVAALSFDSKNRKE